MGFYEEIAKYYDYIFPVKEAQLNLMMELAGHSPKKVLDIACGSGGYSIELAKKGYYVTAVDLDFKMVEELKRKVIDNDNLNIKAMQANMLKISKEVKDKYDLVFCIGNSIVHLNSEEDIEVFLKSVRNCMNKRGSLLLQIVNYKRVLENDVRSLPTITNKDKELEFERLYNFDRENNKIAFKTILDVEGKKIENEILLIPLMVDDLIKLLNKTRFTNIKLYGDFNKTPFDEKESYGLIVVAS
ncbi:MAG: class I SAM-dependent methyltransferase [Eubacteriales bacterium]